MYKLKDKLEKTLIKYGNHAPCITMPCQYIPWNEKVYNRIVSTIEKELNKIENLTQEDIKKFIEDVESEFMKNLEETNNILFSLLVSILISKISNGSNKTINLNFKLPYNFLFVRTNNTEIVTNIIGDYSGCCSKRIKIYSEEGGDYVGIDISDSILVLGSAKDYLGYKGENILIYSKRTGNYTGMFGKNLDMIINEAGNNLACCSNKARVFANVAGKMTGDSITNGELNVNVVLGDYLGYNSNNSIIRVKIVKGKYIGEKARGTIIYVYEIEDIAEDSIGDDFFKDPRNILYVGEETYEKMKKISKYKKYIKNGQIRIWDKKEYEEWSYKMETMLKVLETIYIFNIKLR